MKPVSELTSDDPPLERLRNTWSPAKIFSRLATRREVGARFRPSIAGSSSLPVFREAHVDPSVKPAQASSGGGQHLTFAVRNFVGITIVFFLAIRQGTFMCSRLLSSMACPRNELEPELGGLRSW